MCQTRILVSGTSALVTLLMLVSSAYSQPTMSATRVATGFSRPVFGVVAPGESGRMFVVEQRSGSTGRIRILNLATGTINTTPFFTVAVSTSSEQGLLGLAFHPDYVKNGLFYVNYTSPSGATLIREYDRMNNDQADLSSGRTLLTIPQPAPNHNGGWLGFGPDGFLYISTGDGGGAGDTQNNAQDTTNNLLGKMLRIDPLGNGQYAIPASNPFVGTTDDDEIWAYGLRNPWRCSFDSETGDLYIADVGQNAREEIDVQAANSTGGENYGWRVREGTIGFNPNPPLQGTAIDPIHDYVWSLGGEQGSVTGGYVYRGELSEIQGHYFFADFVKDRVWSLKWDGSNPSTFNGTNYTSLIEWTNVITTDVGTIQNISSFAEDDDGNLYIFDLFGGEIFRIDTATIATVVSPDSFERTAGITQSGGLEELTDSDDSDLVIRPFGPTNAQFEVKGVSPFDNPSAFEVTLEASVSPIFSNVNQVIELFDYDAGAWVEIDVRRAGRIDDDVATVAATGDLSRFVEADTRCVKARICFTSNNARRRFVSATDQFKWAISQ